jgi:hypothetical protein
MKFIYLLLLMVILSAAADAAQLGRTTGEVNFRKAPDRSAPIIERLPAGMEVEVIERNPAGWYFIRQNGRPGFVHESYIKLEKHNERQGSGKATSDQSAKLVGIILMAIGATLILFVVAPFLFKLGTILFGCAVCALTLDLAFKFGMLYSLVCVAVGLLIALLLLNRNKTNSKTSADANALPFKKAA